MIELTGARSKIKISPTVWMMSLELARLCGWEPAGTHRSEGSGGEFGRTGHDARQLLGWQTDYLSSDGQVISHDDSNRLADAFDLAVTGGPQAVEAWQSGRLHLPDRLRTPPGGFRWFSTDAGREHLRSLASFCRQGKFAIH
jgi:hypothetical protein